MKVIYEGCEVRADLSIVDAEKIAEDHEIYIADGNLIVNEVKNND